MIKATIVKPAQNGRNEWEKEKVNYWHVMAHRKGEIINVVTAYCWMGRSSTASTVYAAIWVHGPKETSGRGSAGGGGYHKESAAIQAAITSAGIELYGSAYNPRRGEEIDMKKRAYIDGVGDRAVNEALKAIARAAGYRGKLVIA